MIGLVMAGGLMVGVLIGGTATAGDVMAGVVAEKTETTGVVEVRVVMAEMATGVAAAAGNVGT
jgi:hypothetical protein